MKAMWSLPETTGPGYAEVIIRYLDRYELRQGHVWHKETNTKLAHHPNYGRPTSSTSLEIEYDLKNLEELALKTKLAKLLEQNNCSDFSETPPRNTLEIMAKNRF